MCWTGWSRSSRCIWIGPTAAWSDIGSRWRLRQGDALHYLPATIPDGGGTIIDLLLVPLGREETHQLHAQVWSPSFQRFRQTEAFRQIIRDTGMLAYWRAHRFPPLCRPVGTDDFACE